MDKIRAKFANIAILTPYLSQLPGWLDISVIIKQFLAHKFASNDFSRMIFHDLDLVSHRFPKKANINFSYCKLYSCSFSESIIEQITFNCAKFLYCSFAETELHQVSFIGSEITKTTFVNAIFSNCTLSSTIINDVDFLQACVENSTFSNSVINNCNFDCHIRYSNFNDAKITKCNFIGAYVDDETTMINTSLNDCDFSTYASNVRTLHCDLDKANIKNTRFINSKIDHKYPGGIYDYDDL